MLKLIGLLVFVGLVAAEEKSMTVDDVTVQVVGKSGKIKMWRGDDGGESGKIFIDMSSLQEVDVNGDVVGTSGNTKHSFNSFASQDFIFSDLTPDVLVPNSDGVKATHFSFNCELDGLTSKIRVDAYLLKDNGTITLDGEVREVNEGQLKFSITLEDWEFCTPSTCTKNGGETGKFVDFTIEIKPTGNGDDVNGDGENKWDLGQGSEINFSDKVRADNVWGNMAANYPLYNKQGSKKHQFTFRFPKFNTEAFYDPDLTIGYGSASTTVATIFTLLAAFITTRISLW